MDSIIDNNWFSYCSIDDAYISYTRHVFFTLHKVYTVASTMKNIAKNGFSSVKSDFFIETDKRKIIMCYYYLHIADKQSIRDTLKM